jgi:apolipoprotein N-acyltransferase
MTPLPAFLLCVSGGIAQALAFPEAGLYPLAWLCLIPLYLSAYRQAPGKAFLYGWIYGMALGLASFSWLAGVMSGYGGLGPWGGALVLMILAAFLALYQGLFAWLCAGWDAEGKGFFVNPLLAAFYWTGIDFLKGWIFTGFNWTPLAGALAGEPRLTGLADVLGAYGLGFPVALAGFLACSLMVMQNRARPIETVIAAAGAASCLMAVTLYGIVTYNVWEDEARAARKIELAVLQASVEQEYKWDAAFREEILGRYDQLAKRAAASGPFLTVWPETAAPFTYGRDALETLWIRNLVVETGAPMLAGLAAPAETPDGEFRLRNRAWLLYPDGTPGPFYDKQHLVPFGEYVPFIDELPFLRSAFLQGVLGAAGNFSPGERRPPIEYGGLGFGPLICFESIFPYLARRQAAAGADVLLVTTNDAWFGDSWAAAQHFQHAQLRAAETRLPLARAANDGISGLISPSGRALFRSPRHAVDMYLLEVPLAGREKPTLYVRGGYLFAPLCAAFAAAAFLWLLVARVRLSLKSANQRPHGHGRTPGGGGASPAGRSGKPGRGQKGKKAGKGGGKK